MNLLDAVKSRHSVRSYMERPIEEEKLQQLQASVDQYNREGNLHIRLVTNEPKAFDSRMAHYGKFSGISNYFAMIGPKGETLDERVGYYGEKLVLEAQQLGLNTCWVGLTYSKTKSVLDIQPDEKLICVISLGYGSTQGAGHKIKPKEKVMKVNGAAPDWFIQGVECALLAPTAMNQQKFTFELCEGNKVKAKAGLGFFAKTDLGIVKYHFEIGAGTENFTWK